MTAVFAVGDLGVATIVAQVAMLAAAGAFCGFAIALIGVGGGLVLTPALYLSLVTLGAGEAAGPMAAATSLAIIAWASVGVLRRRAAWRQVDRADWGAMAAGAIAAPFLAESLSSGFFAVALGLALVGVAVSRSLRFMRRSRGDGRAEAEDPPLTLERQSGAVASLAQRGLFATSGAVAGAFGLGGGLAALIAARLRGRSLKTAVEVAPAFALAVAAPALPVFIVTGLDAPDRPVGSIGYLHAPIFAVAAAMSPFGGRVGVWARERLSERQVGIALALYFAAAGAVLLATTLSGGDGAR